MGKLSKATKKFQSKHLKRTMDHRKEVKKHNALVQNRKKKQYSTNETEPKTAGSGEIFEDMDVEQFFEKGFDVVKDKTKGTKHKKSKTTEPESEESSDEETQEEDFEKLAEKDPEFYEYLQKNDKDLLDFNPSNPLDNISDDEGGDSEEEKVAKKSSKKLEEPTKIEITSKLVSEWSKKLEKPSITLIKNVLSGFKAAININKEDTDYKYTVTDPKAFHELIILGLKKIPIAIQKIAPYKVIKNSRTVASNGKNKQLATVLKSHAGSILTLLNDITNTETAILVLSSTQELLPFYISHRRLLKEIVNTIVNVWSTTTDVETQVAAFAFLNNASKEFAKSILELVLKQTYSSFIKNCRQTNVHTMALINFQKNSAAELFGVDENLSYQIGFEYIRQLAIHLRNSINNNQNGYKTIYNWQYVHSLDFWSRVLSVHCNPEREIKKPSALRQLIYPYVQVTLGAIRLIPSAQFFPLRFYLIRSLIRLSQNTGVFIPLYPLLAEILNSTTLTRNPKNSSLESFDFDHNIKANAAFLGTRTYQTGVYEQVVNLLGEYFVLYCKSISFPELATPVTIALRRYIKTSKNVKFNKQLGSIVEKLNQNSDFISRKRANVEFTPTNKTEVHNFLSDLSWDKTPLGEFISVQREIKEQRDKLLRESLLESEKDRKADQESDSELPIESDSNDDSGDEIEQDRDEDSN